MPFNNKKIRLKFKKVLKKQGLSVYKVLIVGFFQVQNHYNKLLILYSIHVFKQENSCDNNTSKRERLLGYKFKIIEVFSCLLPEKKLISKIGASEETFHNSKSLRFSAVCFLKKS